MEHAERVDVAVGRGEKAREGYAWMILAASALLGMVAAVVTTLPPISWFWDPIFQSGYSIMGAWGISWASFNVLALVIVMVPFRRGERWAWYALWMLPLMWLSLFALAPDLLYYPLLAVVTAVALILPYRRFFSGPDDEPSRES